MARTPNERRNDTQAPLPRMPREPEPTQLDAVTLDWMSRFLNRMAFIVGSKALERSNALAQRQARRNARRRK